MRTQTPCAALLRTAPQPEPGRIEIRPARSDDAERMREFLSGLSARTQTLRFLAGVGRPGDGLLRALLTRDADRDVLVALRRGADGGERIVGHAMSVRCALRPGGEGAPPTEIAVVVADDWQGRGIGERLVRRLLTRAAARGAAEIVMDVHGENLRVLKALRRRWPQARMRASYGTVEVRAAFAGR